MYILNFLIAILLPYISFFSKLAPSDAIPTYFFSAEGAFVAGEFGAIVFYWAGFLRNYVANGKITERQYFAGASIVLVFMCATKIVFTLPFSWITSMLAFGLGVLSVSSGEGISNKVLFVMVVISLIIFSFSTFILIGMAWFGFTSIDYYYYKNLLMHVV